METIKDWMRSEAIEMADELVSLNTEQFLKDNIGGFGLRKRSLISLMSLGLRFSQRSMKRSSQPVII